jgi:hypothetical protein
MFVGKACSLPLSGEPACVSLMFALGLLAKTWTKLERPARKKHSSLLGPFVKYVENKML